MDKGNSQWTAPTGSDQRIALDLLTEDREHDHPSQWVELSHQRTLYDDFAFPFLFLVAQMGGREKLQGMFGCLVWCHFSARKRTFYHPH